jgi:GDSL-like Lipase/Acylhydrolase family
MRQIADKSSPRGKWFDRWWARGVLSLLVFALGTGVGWWSSRRDPPPPPPVVIDLPAGRYVALGDSYSAGEGLDPWEGGTQDAPKGNRCHRSSTWAYSRLLTFVNETTPLHRACSGAVIANAYDTPQTHRGVIEPQTVQVTPEVEGSDVVLITITMSGNDAGFSKVLKVCFQHSDCPDRPYVDIDGKEYESLRAWAEERLPKIGHDLVPLYQHLRRSFPNARILVLGYPALFPVERPPISEDPGGICRVLFNEWDAFERAAVREWGAQLNRYIAAATREAVGGIEYVDLAPYFAGHEACGSHGPWLRAVGIASGPVRDGSFHPRRVGQAMIARIVSCHLDVYDSAVEAVTGDYESRFAMAGCVAGQVIGLSEMPASGTPPESAG